MAGRIKASPRSRSAESAAVRKTRELPRLSTGGFGGDSFWDPACHGLLSRGPAYRRIFRPLIWFCPIGWAMFPIPDGNLSLLRGMQWYIGPYDTGPHLKEAFQILPGFLLQVNRARCSQDSLWNRLPSIQ